MPQKVLIVDDEPGLRVLLTQTLEELEDVGVVLLKASNGLEAVEIARRERPDVILLDVMMPGMNGYEVCEVLRGDKALKATRIVMVTARDQAFDQAHGEMVGADHYITKPFDPDAMFDLVRGLLDRP